MRFGFDLDGTLDRPAVRALAHALRDYGHEIHIISGCFTEAGEWQDHQAKHKKLARLGFGTINEFPPSWCGLAGVHVHILDAVSHKEFDRDYRLVDLALRKGSLVEKLGIEMMFDDSELYCKHMPSMCGAQIVRVL